MSSPRQREEDDASTAAEPTPVRAPPTTTTTTTTSTSTGRQSAGLQHFQGRSSTPDRRHPGITTDDAAIFIEDTIDRATAQCIATSPSALAILSPQRMPTSGTHAHVDVTEYDAEYIGTAGGRAASASSTKKGRRSGETGMDSCRVSRGVRLSFGKSPTPKANRKSGSLSASGADTSLSRSTPGKESRLSSCASSAVKRRGGHSTPSPAAARPPGHGPVLSDEDEMMPPEPMVPLRELERVERERNRFEKMYEHQKALYEDMAEKQEATHKNLQEKIVEVVALSTRNEESKKFIRQLKREMAESRTRVMDIQNRALEEARAERNAKSRYESLIEEHEHKYRRTVERHETKMAGMESLLKDLTCMRNEHDRIHVSQLDALLKAAYAKSTALFSDLLRQGRQVDMLYDTKDDLEKQLDQLRREKREAEATLAEERRRMMYESERFIEQIEEQQQSILNLRQMLIRTLDASREDDDDSESDEAFEDYGETYEDHRRPCDRSFDANDDDEDDTNAFDDEEDHLRRSAEDEEEERDDEIGVDRDNRSDWERSLLKLRGGGGGKATPLRDRPIRVVVKTRDPASSTLSKGHREGCRNDSEVNREPRSGSEQRSLEYLRSHLTGHAAARRPTAGEEEEGASGQEASARTSVRSEGAAEGRPVSVTKVPLTSTSSTGALSTNAVVMAQSTARKTGARTNRDDHTESIFSPPQRRRSVSASGKDKDSGKERKQSPDRQTSSRGRTPGDAPVVVMSKPPHLREREAARGGTESTSTRPSSSSREPERRTGEAYRIPRPSEGEDKENEGGAAASMGHNGAATTRKRLDFAAALASVTAKREQERKAREASDKENRSAPGGGGASGAASKSVAAKPGLRVQPSNRSGSGSGGKQRVEDVHDDDDNDDVPRLVPRQAPSRPALRTIPHKSERTSDK